MIESETCYVMLMTNSSGGGNAIIEDNLKLVNSQLRTKSISYIIILNENVTKVEYSIGSVRCNPRIVWYIQADSFILFVQRAGFFF